MKITKRYLKENPDHIFVFGDNLLRKGKKGAAELRDEPNTYGFVTKKAPNNKPSSFYTPEEYEDVFAVEMAELATEIKNTPQKMYLISKLGAGLANRYNIWEEVIEFQIKYFLKGYSNVQFLW